MILLHTLLAPRYCTILNLRNVSLKYIFNALVSLYLLWQWFSSLAIFTKLFAGKKYDLEFKSSKKSGLNFKTGDDMMEMYSKMYSKLCSGITGLWIDISFWVHLLISWSFKNSVHWFFPSIFCARVPTCLHRTALWQRWLGALKSEALVNIKPMN